MQKLFKILSILFCVVTLTSGTTFADGFNSVHTSNAIYVIAVGNSGNIFRSSNSGNTWAKYTEGSVNFKSVHTFGTNVWIAADNGIVYKSSTSTTILTPYNSGVTSSLNSIFFIDANTGFVCGDNGVVMKTVDGGITWTPSSTGISSSVKLNSISFKDASNGFAVGNGGVNYMTVNGGSSWAPAGITTTRNLLKVKFFNDGAAAAGEWGTLFVKAGAGSWDQINTRINTDIRGIDGVSFNDVHVCGGGGFIRNNINGSTEFLNFEKNPMLADLVDLIYFSGIGFAVSSMNNAIIRTTNGGTSWTLTAGATVTYGWVAKPGASGNFLGNNMCLHPTNRDAVFIAFGNRVYRSNDKGENWAAIGANIPSGNTPHSFFVSPIDTNIWLVATESSPDRVYRTTNYGQDWTQVLNLNFSNYGQPLEMDQNNPHVFYFAPDNGGFWKSTDDGATFTEISGNYAFRSPCDILVAFENSDMVFLADGVTGSGQAKIYKSVNAGINWTLVHTVSSSEVPSMCNTVFQKNVVWATEWSGSNIYYSSNFGDNWSTHHSTGFSGWGSDVCREDPDMIITGSWGASATMSLDGGATWTNVSSGLSGHGGGILIPDRGYILCHQGSNVYKLNVTYSVITDISENVISSVPNGFELSQNYPNPFNPTTTIKFSIPKSGNVSLKVYNELGKEVNSLVNSYKNAGSYEINFDASSLTSGIYFYKIDAEGITATKKMVLIK